MRRICHAKRSQVVGNGSPFPFLRQKTGKEKVVMNGGLEGKNIVVFLGSANVAGPVFRQGVKDLGKFLAEHDMTLVFGGSNCGMMKLLADTVLAEHGKVVGVFTKCLSKRWLREDLTESILTETLAERKEEMLRRADAVIALPGGFGTFDELFEALAQRKLRGITCPIGVLNIAGFFDPLFALLKNSKECGFSSGRAVNLLKSGETPEELFRNLSA